MKKLFFIVLSLSTFCNVFAQTLTDYPSRKNIESEKFSKAETDINKNLSKNSLSVDYNYAAYKLYSNKNYKSYDIQTAYNYIVTSKKTFESSTPKEIEKLNKKGFSKWIFNSEIESICGSALNRAQQQNTIDGYNYFLNTFTLAPKNQVSTATNNRNKIAYQLAEQENTLESYQNFIAKYPDAQERDLAYQNILKIEFATAEKKGTEDAYRTFLTKYPNTKYTQIVNKKLELFDFFKKVIPNDWKSYANYLKINKVNNEIISIAEDSICNIIIRNPKTEDVKSAYSILKNYENKNKMIRLLHDKYTQTPSINLSSFWYEYSDNNLSDLREHDSKISNLTALLNPEQFIIDAAPYRCAYESLIDLIKPDLKAKNYSLALETVLKFSEYFGDDSDFNSLVNTLQLTDNKNIKAVAFSQNINTTDGQEYAPCISADGKTLLFCATNRKESIGGEDIFISTLKNGVWQKATPLNDINTIFSNEAPEVLSTSGNQLLMFQNGKLLYSNKEKTGWSTPEYLNDNINFSDWQADPTFSSDGKVMIFAAKAINDYELEKSINIFVSIKDENGEWGPAFDIGKNINTPMTDRSPVLHPDMKTLYFCSNGHGNLGSIDVFMSTRLKEDSWTEWSTPINLGKEINTTEQECFYKISTDGKTAYFSKQYNGNLDVYYTSIPERVRPNPVATISGKLVNKNGEPVSTKISWEDLESHQLIGESETNPQNGEFFIVLPEGKNYGYFISDPKYFPTSSNIDLRGKDELIAIEKNINLVTIEEMIDKQIPIVLNNLFFNSGEYVLLPASQTELQRVYKILEERHLKVEISGHTDSRSDDTYNQQLSENRANAVKDYLVSLGYSSNMLTTIGYGEKKPIADNKTAEGRQKNRRVELRVIK